MLRLNNISRRVSSSFSLSDLNLEIPEGTYFVLLGRSGAGKTQMLELIAGLEKPDSGSVWLDGKDITNSRIQDRRIGIVFQDYAIFPHMSVFGNIAYPLRSSRLPEKEIKDLVSEAASHVNVLHLLDRQINGLSGGEKQRIALARTLVRSPRLILLDEPLSSLDASLRDEMRQLLRKLNREGNTIVHISHDFTDAISLAQRVGVMHNGRIIQEGTVNEVFSKPANRFVARYAGYRNFFSIDITKDEKGFYGITRNGLKFSLSEKMPGENCIAVIRGENISLNRSDRQAGDNSFPGNIEEVIPTGTGSEIKVDAGEIFYVTVNGNNIFREGERVSLSFSPGDIVIISGNTE